VVSTDTRLRTFLSSVLDLAEQPSVELMPEHGVGLLSDLQWTAARSVLMGDAPFGLVEIVEVECTSGERPDPLVPRVSLAFNVLDLESVRDRALGSEFGVSPQPARMVFGGHEILVDMWSIGHVGIQITQVLSDDGGNG
jgi:hypothetical protein